MKDVTGMGVRRLFPGEGKIFQEGQNILFALKTPKTYYFPLKKVKKKTILAGQGGPGGQGPGPPSCPPLRTPMEMMLIYFCHQMVCILRDL